MYRAAVCFFSSKDRVENFGGRAGRGTRARRAVRSVSRVWTARSMWAAVTALLSARAAMRRPIFSSMARRARAVSGSRAGGSAPWARSRSSSWEATSRSRADRSTRMEARHTFKFDRPLHWR